MDTKQQRTYIAIDLKSFYASVECVERGLDALSTNLVVADKSRTDKTICLAVSPPLKAHGIPGRARLFEVVQQVREVNAERLRGISSHRFVGKSSNATELQVHPDWQLDYIVAKPRMALYIDYSARIYSIYLKYIAPEDIHVYSIDEVFMDVTDYLKCCYKTTARELAMTIIKNVLKQTGITATVGIGSNLYLAKVAMDIVAKHSPADENGVRIAELTEMSYREKLWNFRPLSKFWRIGRGIAKRLDPYGIDTMGKLARFSLEHEELLYKLFGVNAELLIDHAWGWEPCTMRDVKSYKPITKSISNGQVLSRAYNCKQARVVAMEMAYALSLDLVNRGLVTNQLMLTVGYDVECLKNEAIATRYHGPVSVDWCGRKVPRHGHDTARLGVKTSSVSVITKTILSLFDRVVDDQLLVRRIGLVACHIQAEEDAFAPQSRQLELFIDYDKLRVAQQKVAYTFALERQVQEAVLAIKRRYGKNAILLGLNFQEGATMKERNQQIGGHHA